MRILAIPALVLAASVIVAADGQPEFRQLAQLFPDAAGFSRKSGDPPHVIAYGPDDLVLGYAFWTTEIDPTDRGYDGPIQILVGLDLQGLLTGIVVGYHHEPYGNFSIEQPAFTAQFRGKDVRSAFKIGEDLHGVSRATISVTSAARTVRNSARRMAQALLPPPPKKKPPLP
jgi:NosR/NirI family nitrous oxide reductase transcriptional regulator